jgi:hypothetical protein
MELRLIIGGSIILAIGMAMALVGGVYFTWPTPVSTPIDWAGRICFFGAIPTMLLGLVSALIGVVLKLRR